MRRQYETRQQCNRRLCGECVGGGFAGRQQLGGECGLRLLPTLAQLGADRRAGQRVLEQIGQRRQRRFWLLIQFKLDQCCQFIQRIGERYRCHDCLAV
jgi:hypothetical protein